MVDLSIVMLLEDMGRYGPSSWKIWEDPVDTWMNWGELASTKISGANLRRSLSFLWTESIHSVTRA